MTIEPLSSATVGILFTGAWLIGRDHSEYNYYRKASHDYTATYHAEKRPGNRYALLLCVYIFLMFNISPGWSFGIHSSIVVTSVLWCFGCILWPYHPPTPPTPSVVSEGRLRPALRRWRLKTVGAWKLARPSETDHQTQSQVR